jgi:methyl-accepting chemotaxis protein
MSSKRSAGLTGWLENKSFSQRLAVQVTAVIVSSICLVSAMAVGGWVLFGHVERNAHASDQALYAALLEKDFASLERDVFRHALLHNDKTQADYEGNIGDFKTSIADTRQRLDATMLSAADTVSSNADAYVGRVNGVLSRGAVDEAGEAEISDGGDVVDSGIEAIREPAIAEAATAAAAQKRTTIIVLAGTIALAALAGLVTLLLVRAVRNAIGVEIEAVSSAIAGIASGRLDVDIDYTERDDQIGTLARAAVQLRETSRAKRQADMEMADMAGKVGAALGQLAKGDLTVELPELGDNFTGLRRDFNSAIAQLNTTMATVSDAAGGIRNGAREINSASGDLAERTEHHAAELATVAEAVNQITSALQESAAMATRASEGVTAAVSEARNGGEIVGRAVGAMANIEKSSDEIGQIINVIDGIAFQTNLLALNAGVEAARAGDAGKGFAVVANEVRALAQRSADAAKDIKALITTSGAEVQGGAVMVRQAGEALDQITARIDGITQLVTQITQSASEQSHRLGEINGAMSKMDQVTQQNAAMVEQSTAAARSLLQEADGLNVSVDRFTCRLDGAACRSPAAIAPPAPPRASRPKVAARPPAVAKPAGALSAAVSAVAGNLALAAVPAPSATVQDDDWTEF